MTTAAPALVETVTALQQAFGAADASAAAPQDPGGSMLAAA